MPGSLYSAKARSFLRKHRVDHVERPPGHPRYLETVVPAIGRWIIPVLELPDGTLIQDTVDIIDHLWRSGAAPSPYPEGPQLRVVAHVLELFGGEGLLRPAMHYRWNFDQQNLAFLADDFAGGLVPGAGPEERAAAFATASSRMRRAAVAFGVVPELIPVVEGAYLDFLTLLAAHLETTPYLLGGSPTVADFAFMGPLYPHLARDPAPADLMKRHAWRVWRWVERMNAPVADTGEYGDPPAALFPDDAVPATLVALLAYIGEEHVPELVAQVAVVDRWLEEHPEVAEGDVVGGRPDRRFLGTATCTWRGHELTTSVVPYRLYLLGRLQATAAAAPPAARSALDRLLGPCGLGPLLRLRARRPVERRDNREVWGAEQEPSLG